MEIRTTTLILKEQGPPLTEDILSNVESIFGEYFPDTYRRFILLNNGGTPYPDAIDITDFPGGTTDVQVFFRIGGNVVSSEILWNLQFVQEAFPNKKLLPIACDSAGGIFCLERSEKSEDEVFFYDWGFLENQHVYRKLYPVANSFAEFIKKIKAD
jgi:hypothetical protein